LGVVQIPRRVIRFNNAINNPIQGQFAWLLPPWAVVSHRGRRSGRQYRTPVIAFKRGTTLSIGILYGERSDWVQNLLAGGGEVVRGGRTYELVNPRIADARSANGISAAGRAYGRVSGNVLVAELGDRRPEFGRGPRAG
jgi:deazaflavin-dependent oxidoreductase (nitroreductase family)